MKELEQVSEFMRMSNQAILKEPVIPSDKVCEFRFDLIVEEFQETMEATEKGDLVEVADGLCDLLYVLLGTVNTFGLNSRFEALFNEVHRSNLSKACKTHQHALDTLHYYEKKKNTLCQIVEFGDLWLVQRLEDGKQMKCVHNFSEPNLKAILQ